MTEKEYDTFCALALEFYKEYAKKNAGKQETEDLKHAVDRLNRYNTDHIKRLIAIAAIQAKIVTEGFKEANKHLEDDKDNLADLVNALNKSGKVVGAIISAAASLCV